ncbi:hypothetical protein RFI_29700 [Reticulomyxa filosa]|uniref:Chromo domain-containing protein n=1 Tax=Reticulomyxa filosa TaxID=46433 RepID=X6M3T6_RETFI|nr:hypothetical protein RFI_29700 [Reticulomyxa filosa]|eukprot:ETO07690.1 hypothetical protein RFI_29700 [Reticulomyxa filosa]
MGDGENSDSDGNEMECNSNGNGNNNSTSNSTSNSNNNGNGTESKGLRKKKTHPTKHGKYPYFGLSVYCVYSYCCCCFILSFFSTSFSKTKLKNKKQYKECICVCFFFFLKKKLGIITSDDHNEIDNHSPTDNIPPKKCIENLEEKTLEFLVKYRDKSYLHCEWRSYNNLVSCLDEKQVTRIMRKWTSDGKPQCYYQQPVFSAPLGENGEHIDHSKHSVDVHYFDPLFTVIDRILDDNPKTKGKKKEYLIKWQGLPYSEVIAFVFFKFLFHFKFIFL